MDGTTVMKHLVLVKETKRVEAEIARVEIMTTPLGGDEPSDEPSASSSYVNNHGSHMS